jgi:radical SAM superfamily enzyme YgiQ (UPF0313 family)
VRGIDPLSARPKRPARQRHQGQRPGESSLPVLYVHPSKQGPGFDASSELGRPYGLFPVGLPALVNLLRDNGIEVQGVVHPLEMQLDDSFRLDSWLRERQTAKVILIDLHWYEHCYGAIETARLCKQVLSHAKIIMGGLSASGFACEILDNFPFIDYILRGDAEIPLLHLVKLLLSDSSPSAEALAEVANLSYRAEGAVIENSLGYHATTEDLDRLNFADIDFIQHHREYYVHEYIVTDLSRARQALETSPFTGRWVTTARGCKFNCSYCGGGRSAHKILAGRVGIIPRSAPVVVDELCRLSELGVIQASLAYDIAEMGEDYWLSFFAAMRQKNLKIGLYNEFFQLPSVSFVKEFAAHCDKEHSCVALSPLSGNEHVRRLNGKHYSNEAFFDLLDELARQKLYLFVYFSLNLPGETRETFEETLDFAREIYEFYPSPLLKMLNTVHTLDPLSPMNVHADKFGIQAGMSTFMDYYTYCRDTGNLDPASKTGLNRGFDMPGRTQLDLEAMVKAWDRDRLGREISWWPVPSGW